MRASAHLDIAERTFGSRGSLALLRLALAIVFLWFGGMKFTSYEALGNAPLIDHSPVMSWLNVVFGVQGASDVIGVIELSTAVLLILGAFYAAASVLYPAAPSTRPRSCEDDTSRLSKACPDGISNFVGCVRS